MKSFLLLFLLCLAAAVAAAADAPVTVTQDAECFTLVNGVLSARIAKRTGTLTSLRLGDQELLARRGSGAEGGYWSSVGQARPGGGATQAILEVNPATNGGRFAQITIRQANAPGETVAPMDVDLCYALHRGESGLYTWAVWSHAPGYAPCSVGEARYCLKLNPEIFDFLTIDEARRRLMPSPADWDRGAPLNVKEARRMTTGVQRGAAEHKYGYSAVFADTPAYGWSSTANNVGLWIINPSLEYLAGGPTKLELTGHLDVNPGGTPTLLNMWLGSHYGGSAFAVGRSEAWKKVIGPFLIYCNALPQQAANSPGSAAANAAQRQLWQDALARAATEAARWPYAWLQHPEYPPAAVRGTLTGQLVLRDPLAPEQRLTNAWIGLTTPDYVPASSGFGGAGRDFGSAGGGVRGPGGALGRGGFPRLVDWQRDAKYYQFWVRPDAAGRFTLRHIRPGTYTLRAISDGVIGEFALTNVTVAAASTNALGTVEWSRTRFGRTVWQIGIPNRTAREFRHGTNAWQWGTYFKYPADFPTDVDFTIGLSDWRRDWNYVQPPRWLPAGGGQGAGAESAPWRRPIESSTWTIRFDLPAAPIGRAALRLAFCGSHAGCSVQAQVNDHPIGETGPLPSTSAMQRDGAQAYWTERRLAFDASRLRAGTNILRLHSPANSWSQGVMYDVVRLELDESPTPPK